VDVLLDTNVVSELMKKVPDPSVALWQSRQPQTSLFVSAVTQAEMLFGARTLPAGQRRRLLELSLDNIFGKSFSGRVLAFDSNCAGHFADLVAARHKRGKPIGQFDAQIASIARAHHMPVATRNVRDFEDCGVVVINPWLSA
jgi:toxin FitB